MGITRDYMVSDGEGEISLRLRNGKVEVTNDDGEYLEVSIANLDDLIEAMRLIRESVK